MQDTNRKCILVVDDCLAIAEEITHHLQTLGFSTQLLTDADEALLAAQTTDFCAAIIDFVMPKKSGLQLARSLRDNGIDFPVIICSGYPLEHVKSDSKGLGIIAFLDKPIRREALSEALIQALA